MEENIVSSLHDARKEKKSRIEKDITTKNYKKRRKKHQKIKKKKFSPVCPFRLPHSDMTFVSTSDNTLCGCCYRSTTFTAALWKFPLIPTFTILFVRNVCG